MRVEDPETVLERADTLYNWVYLRRIPFVKLGRSLRFDQDEIERIVRSSSTLEVASRR